MRLLQNRTTPDAYTSALPPALGACTDWDAQWIAVTTQLRLIVGQQVADSDDPLVMDMARRVQTGVLACVTALEQLRGLLLREIGRYSQLERQTRETQATLTDAQQALAALRSAVQQNHHTARCDDLTTLPNRNHFRERLGRALAPPQRRTAPPAVLYLDLDGFNAVNDEHGHPAGDELLRIVALRLSRAVRAEDVISRQGSDEFACMVSDSVSREQLSHVACKLFDAVSAPVKIGALQLTVQPSIGIAVCPTDGATAGALLKSAEAAMYQAKRRHCGYAFFDNVAGA
jgi:diguanylate cyclase